MQRYEVRIHEVRGHTIYVEADTPGEAKTMAMNRWGDGDDGDPMQEESVGWEVISVNPVDAEGKYLGIKLPTAEEVRRAIDEGERELREKYERNRREQKAGLERMRGMIIG